ncbi:MAG: TIM barrel protein [Planctomycetes bacterium]|nr:TIM barrel protein [Planctomycetota bacterium]
MAGTFRFSFGPWNIHEGADPFGPAVRTPYSFAEKLEFYKKLGYEGVQFHDDDAVPEIDGKSHKQVLAEAREVRKMLDDRGLAAEFVAPRLWENPQTIDGGYTSNDPTCRKYAIDRSLVSVDIANELGCDRIVLWLAREGTYIREAKDARKAVEWTIEAIDKMLAHDPKIRVLIEPKPNEPMDHAYIPTIGHALAVAYRTADPARVGGLIETAHAFLAGLDPSDEMAFAIAHGKLWSVHLNDQNGLKFDQDKSFGSNNLRTAFNMVRVLDQNDYGANGEFVGMDVKVMRTQAREKSLAHLANSRQVFLWLLEKVRTLDAKLVDQYREARDYEGLDLYINRHLLGIK